MGADCRGRERRCKRPGGVESVTPISESAYHWTEGVRPLRPVRTRTAEMMPATRQTLAMRTTSPQCPGMNTAMRIAEPSHIAASKARAKPIPESTSRYRWRIEVLIDSCIGFSRPLAEVATEALAT